MNATGSTGQAPQGFAIPAGCCVFGGLFSRPAYRDDKDVMLLVLKFRIEWEQFNSEGFSQSSWRPHRIFPLTESSRRDTLFLEETAVCLQKTFITKPSSTRCSMMAGLLRTIRLPCDMVASICMLIWVHNGLFAPKKVSRRLSWK